MAKFFPMFSGSKGNATYIGNAQGGVLIDVGVSFKKIKDALAGAEIPVTHIKAVLITHEHSDHIKGLRVFLKNHPVPVIASRDTIYALEFAGAIDRNYERVYIDEIPQHQVEDIMVKRYATSHDCKGSSCYTVTLGGDVKTAVCTDLGVITPDLIQAFAGANIVMLESNHDPVMLRLGPYPPELKLRVGSDKGHLPNALCAETIKALYEMGTNRFVLAHLSEVNNTPEKAASAVRAALMDIGAIENSDYILYVAPPQGKRVIPI
jgi:phosphoribosyl 1,2-cyclic phosphodiesterase